MRFHISVMNFFVFERFKFPHKPALNRIGRTDAVRHPVQVCVSEERQKTDDNNAGRTILIIQQSTKTIQTIRTKIILCNFYEYDELSRSEGIPVSTVVISIRQK